MMDDANLDMLQMDYDKTGLWPAMGNEGETYSPYPTTATS